MNPSWLVHVPDYIARNNHSSPPLGKLIDVKDNAEEMKQQVEFSDRNLGPVDGFTDGELVDALEHFFWGKKNGLSLELGALDGSPHTRSMTYAYHESLGWDRILVEANPTYRADMIKNSPDALSINAAICSTPGKVHFAHSDYVGGIVEFMSSGFLSQYHSSIYKAGTPPGNISSIDWSQLSNVKEIECIPLSRVFSYFRISHVNFFILDVEGGEYEILQSINWKEVTFDVLCVETEPSNRPLGYDGKVTSFLEERGYHNFTGQVGRNMWFVHNSFTPSLRPGLAKDCFNGWIKSDNADRRYYNKRLPPFVRCPMTEV